VLDAGGISPSPRVEFAVNVLLPIVKFALPKETVPTTLVELLGAELGILAGCVLDGGGMSPSPRLEFAVNVLLPIVKFALPKETVPITLTGLLGVEIGGISPFPPSLRLVAVDPDRVKFAEPIDTVTITAVEGVITPADAVEINVPIDPETVKLLSPDEARTFDEPIETGGIKPWLPVETNVLLDPEDEIKALPTLTMVVVLTNWVKLELGKLDALGDGGTSPPLPDDV
jgi:hypothetical protein